MPADHGGSAVWTLGTWAEDVLSTLVTRDAGQSSVTLVLDGLEAITDTDPRRALSDFLTRLPQGFRLVLSTRHVPGAPVPRTPLLRGSARTRPARPEVHLSRGSRAPRRRAGARPVRSTDRRAVPGHRGLGRRIVHHRTCPCTGRRENRLRGRQLHLRRLHSTGPPHQRDHSERGYVDRLGPTNVNSVLLFRNMLPAQDFPNPIRNVAKGQDPAKVMGAYYPTST